MPKELKVTENQPVVVLNKLDIDKSIIINKCKVLSQKKKKIVRRKIVEKKKLRSKQIKFNEPRVGDTILYRIKRKASPDKKENYIFSEILEATVTKFDRSKSKMEIEFNQKPFSSDEFDRILPIGLTVKDDDDEEKEEEEEKFNTFPHLLMHYGKKRRTKKKND